MTNKEKEQLFYLLNLFFAENDINSRDFLCKNKIAMLLKTKLKEFGRWRSLPRGKFRINRD